MKYFPLTLGVRRIQWGAKNEAGRAKSDATGEIRESVLRRDDHTCQCCGFRAEKYQKIHHINGDVNDFRDDNLQTLCVFCHQCFDLSEVNAMGSGKLIWLPEIPQASLHHIMRALYIARVTQGPLAEAARKTFDAFLARGDEAKKRLGSTDPGALALVMKDFLTQAQYQQVQEKIEGIRLLPLDRRMISEGDLEFNQFPQILAYWRAKHGPFGTIPAQEWPRLFQEAQALAAS